MDKDTGKMNRLNLLGALSTSERRGTKSAEIFNCTSACRPQDVANRVLFSSYVVKRSRGGYEYRLYALTLVIRSSTFLH